MSRIPKPGAFKRPALDETAKVGGAELPTAKKDTPRPPIKSVAAPKGTEKRFAVPAPLQERKNVCRTATGTAKRPMAQRTVPSSGPAVAQQQQHDGPADKRRLLDSDVTERLEALERSMMTSSEKQQRLEEKVSILEQQKATLEVANSSHALTIQKTSAEIEQLQLVNRTLKNELMDANEQIGRMKRALEDSQAELGRERKQKEAMENAISEMSGEKRLIQIQLDTMTSKITLIEEEMKSWQSRCLEAEKNLAAAKEKIAADELIRRHLHNTVIELKGNIRVFCRMRPLLPHEEDPNAVNFYAFPDSEGKQIELTKPCADTNETFKSATFEFDHVFTPESTQTDVFQEISQLVQSALDGYNVCVFAYGQTGSGKTYTMEGGENFEETPGMVTLAVEQIFRTSQELAEQGWEFTMSASVLEIYNETLRDLLAKDTAPGGLEIKLVSAASSKNGGRPSQNEVTVPGLTLVDVHSVAEVHRLIMTARKARAVAATKCNLRSSRSHSVFCLRINSRNHRTGASCQGTLNLVDLAGSERLKESGSEGQRLEETKNINRSLSCLGQVFVSLSKKEAHIPYRNSKLTYLLQNSLGGNSKTLMFVTISPKYEHASETLNSLRFATMVNQCHIGVATRKIA